MIYLSILCLSFLTALLLYWVIDQRLQQLNYIVGGMFLLLAIMATLRAPYLDRDYQSYLDLFFKESAFMYMEPTFRGISYIVHRYLNANSIYLFAAYAILGLSIKFMDTIYMSCDKLGTIVVFISNYYLYHDLTQIRVSVGVAFFFLAVYFVYWRKIIIAALLIIVAVLFHYSLLIGLPVLLLRPHKMRKGVYLALIVIAYLIAGFDIKFSALLDYVQLNIPFLEYKISANAVVAEVTQAVPVKIYNWMQMLRIAVAVVMIYKIEAMQRITPYAILMTKLYVAGIVCFVIFNDNGIYAFRVNQMFSYAEVFLIPAVALLLNDRRIGKLAVSFYALVFLSYNLFYAQLFSFWL